MNPQTAIRLAVPEDGPALARIYGQYIDTPVTFECIRPTDAEFSNRIRRISSIYPYLVCERDGQIAGYAYAHRQMERAAYGWNAELSIYLDAGHTSAGLGRRMYGVLMELLRLQGVHNVYGVVTVPNEKSERLHLGMGFRQIGVHRHTGYKCGAWWDVAWFERGLLPCTGEPEPLRTIDELPRMDVERILKMQ